VSCNVFSRPQAGAFRAAAAYSTCSPVFRFCVKSKGEKLPGLSCVFPALLAPAVNIVKILWVKSDYLHPTTRGGQIRSLEMLRCLHQRHEVHYVCLDDGLNAEGPERAPEYCTRAYPIYHVAPPRRSVRFAGQLLRGLISDLPVSVERYASRPMRARISELLAANSFDCIVCDFLFPAPNIPRMRDAVLFQHNVEATIWERHAAQAGNPVARAYLKGQARGMEAYERAICRDAGYVVAVSERDRNTMQIRYGVDHVSSIPTGVNLSYFAPPAVREPKADLVFVGSMDWLPNIDGARFFLDHIRPKIQAAMAGCRIAFVGRRPESWLEQIAKKDPHLIVTGTVPDVRPWLWGSAVSIVPLRIGGGTRLKIFEAMAARVSVVSTTIGAEGLPVEHGRHLLVADDPAGFADACLLLLKDSARREQLAREALSCVKARFSWEAVAREFETILAAHPPGSKDR
jgi:polysaccharide biosynthesis protein PslH